MNFSFDAGRGIARIVSLDGITLRPTLFRMFAGITNANAANVFLGGLAIALVWCSRRKLLGTTLLAPGVWTAVSLGLLGGALSLAQISTGSTWVEPLKYVAAVGTFCPLMALLGAKRPQNLAWQWIVASLWLVLALPAVETLLFRSGQPVYVAPAWSWLMLILLGLEALNHLPTRFWPSTLLTLFGQVLLLSPSLPWPFKRLETGWEAGGLYALVAALGLVVLGWPAARGPKSGLDRLWLDFRDSFGAAWGLRIAQRLQETARLAEWNLLVTWSGFVQTKGNPGLGPAEGEKLLQAVESLLWRFVSPEWIAARLDSSQPSLPPPNPSNQAQDSATADRQSEA